MSQPRLKVVDGEGKDGSKDFDPFKGEDNGYDVDKFYTSARDGAGNSETKYCKFSGSILGQIGALVSSRQIPQYKTEADFIRDACYHRLKHVGEMINDGRLIDAVNRAVKLDRIQARQIELAEFSAIVHTHEEAMQACVANEDVYLLEDLLSDAVSDWEELRPNYQRRLSVIIDKYRAELARLKERAKDSEGR